MIRVTEPYFWADGQTVSCYVRSPESNAKYIVLQIIDCENAYPSLPLYQAIREFAKEVFQEMISKRD